jgi:aminomethyltransferase
MGKRTPLYASHLLAQAKMVDFGGWDMPLHYGSQVQEHHQVRRHAGVFDVSHMTISDLEGPRAQAFLRYLLANDVARLKTPGKALYSCMLNPAGGILDDLIVYWLGGERYRLVTNAATRDKDLAWIRQQAQAFDLAPSVRDDLAMLAVQGPQARALCLPLLAPELREPAERLANFHACEHGEWMVARTGYTGEDGFEIMLPAGQAPVLWDALLAAGVAPIGLGARDTLRLEAGMCLYGQDMNETTSPCESGLNWTVAWEPAERDFIGRASLRPQCAGATQQLVGLVLLDKKGVLRGHQIVHVPGIGEGEITSGGFSPTLGLSIALARIPAQPAKEVEVEIRGKRLSAWVVKPPFARHGRACIEI